MKNCFKRMWAAVMVVMLCVAALSSCHTNEKYEFEFSMPGQVVTTLGSTIVVPYKAVNISTVSVTASPAGWTVESMDVVNCTVTVTAPSSFANEENDIEENGLIKLSGYTAAGTSVYISSYLSLLNRSVDLTAEPSNCYAISQKDTRYTIDVTHKGESSERISPAKVDVIWQTSTYLLDFDGFDPESGTYTFYIGSEDITDDNDEVIGTRMPKGNAVIGAYNEADELIWSWHIWLTDADVDEMAISTSAGEIMDRNIGAYTNSNGSTDTELIYDSYGLYFQWGRKDPFPRPRDYKFTNNRDELAYTGGGASKLFRYVTAEMVEGEVRNHPFGTMDYAIADPFTFILGTADNDFDWLHGEHDASLWSATAKSKNDPCPRGWRVPDASVFTNFDIDAEQDAAALADVRNMYGWHLVDKTTGVKIFMPGAGRRSYENGVLTNMNNYGYDHNPAPWIGYYWTASSTNGNKAQSMFFDLNTTRAVNNRYEAQKAMYRGNGMQVRCVRE
ncbi:MAG: hypothetical protein IKY76_06870 [Alistipes sp.]|nr:hypothetical protein [Alistipes sp.]